MTYEKLFKLLRDTDYKQSGVDCDWQVLVNHTEKIAFVLFQESCSRSDWVHDFLAIPIPCKPYKKMKRLWFAHYGFMRVYKSARNKIIQDIKEMLDTVDLTEYKFVIAGYSLGGALAQLCAEDVFFTLGYKSTVITYGSPRPFFGRYSLKWALRAMNGDSISFHNGTDLVPILPPYCKGLKNTHIGEKFSWLKCKKASDYHNGYGEKTLYKHLGKVK